MTPDQFLTFLEKQRAKTGETPTAFGVRVAGDPRFLFMLQEGREARFSTQQKVLERLKTTQPKRKAA